MIMNEVDYFSGRARHYLQKAAVATDVTLREAFEAVALEFSARAATGNRMRELRLVDGIAPEF